MKDGTTKIIIKDWATTYTAKLSGFDGGHTKNMLDTVLSLIVAAGHSKQSLDDLIVQKAYEIEPPQKENGHAFVEELLERYPKANERGFSPDDISNILKFFGDDEINMEKFNDVMMGNTGVVTDGGVFLTYHTDLRRALICGLEGRGLRVGEFD